MKKSINIKTICLAAAAVFLVAGLTVGTAMAYFTTYAVAQGGYPVKLGRTETEIEEEVDVIDPRKEIQIKNTGDYDCYVRLKALTGDYYKENMRYSEPGEEGKWTPGADGYYYYSDILSPDELSTQINVGFEFPKEKLTQFNVIIIQECTPVFYDAAGNPYADWNVKADISQSVYE